MCVFVFFFVLRKGEMLYAPSRGRSFISSSKSAPSVKKPRGIFVFVSLVLARITFAGYVIVIFCA